MPDIITNLEMQGKAIDALHFLDSHPAFNHDTGSFLSSQCIYAYKCSKYGETELDPCTIWRNDPNFEKFKDKFEEDDDSIYVSHVEKYGEPWKLDHVRYYYDLTISIYEGNFEKDNEQSWGRYCAIRGYAKSFDEMIIECSERVKKYFGEYNDYDSLHTAGETQNHKQYDCFLFEDTTTTHINPRTQKTEKCYSMIENPKYLHVASNVINRRWLKKVYQNEWFVENWKDTFNKLIENTPEWVWDLSKSK